RERARMRDGVLDGVTRIFSDGRETARIRYRGGRMHGPLRMYDAAGRVTWKAEYRSGVLHGETVAYRGGEEAEVTLWSAGVQHGEAITFHPGGVIASRIPWVAGRMEGTAHWYAPGGELVRSSQWVAGALDGETLEYRPRGAVRSRSVYRAGALLHVTEYAPEGDGERKTWFQEGAPVWTVECRAKAPPPADGLARFC
ncbi:MAG TPA: hypothetical protein VFY65_03360, partial [Longimicrobium sp.]|nr:hypothetical protein [Longimicrobium sp.]